MLQWGRDQMVAEMRRYHSSVLPVTPLQWGRDQMVAEIIPDMEEINDACRLQWGRDQMVAEIPVEVVGTAACRRASMGPRPDGRGNTHGLPR